MGAEIAHVARDSDTTFKFKRSKVKVTCEAGHIVAASRTACWKQRYKDKSKGRMVVADNVLGLVTEDGGSYCWIWRTRDVGTRQIKLASMKTEPTILAIGYSKENLKIHTGSPPLPSFSPFPSIPFFPSPAFSSLSPFLSLPISPFP